MQAPKDQKDRNNKSEPDARIHSLAPICDCCGDSLPLAGLSATCRAFLPCRYQGSAGILTRLGEVVRRKGPRHCIGILTREAVESIAGELVAGNDLVTAIDGVDTCCEYMSNPWMLTLFPPVFGVYGGLLSQHGELRAEGGARARRNNRRCVDHLDKVAPNSPSYKMAMGDKAVVLTGRVMFELADHNYVGAVSIAELASAAARQSGDVHVQGLVFRARAKVLDQIGDPTTAAAFQAMADRLETATAAPIWFHPRLWSLNDEEEEALAA